MYQKDYYKDQNEKQIELSIKQEGFDPVKFYNEPGYIYSSHSHPETKVLAFLEGSMRVIVEGEAFECQKGDRLVIPGNKIHSAIVGKEGCSFFWSEKLMS